MATLSGAMRHVKQHLHLLISDDKVFELCDQLNHRWRKRLLDPAVTIQLFLLQLLAAVSMSGVRHVADISVTAQAICAAKMRLPLTLLSRLVERSVPADAVVSTWHGLKVYIADGLSFLTQDTPELAGHYGKAKNHKGVGYGYPNPKLLALMDLAGGYIHKIIALPWHRQEFTCLSRLFRAIGTGGLLLGDRGLVSFTHLAMMTKQGIAGCFRLPRSQVVFSNKRRKSKGKARPTRQHAQRLGRQDNMVIWRASRRPGWLSRQRWSTFADQELRLRQVSFRVTRPGFRTHWAWIITTLTDPKKYPAQELIDLYSKRWQIEVYFRDIKRTLKMSLTSARTLEGTRKEILAFVLLYNLIRGVMAKAAANQQVPADRISFVDALRWLLWSSPGDDLPVLVVNPVRKRRTPARRIKAGRHRFAQLKGTRAATSKPPCNAKL